MTDTIAVPGLTAPAEILVDRWGIPHLTASSLDDLFLLQGFNAARDRLWQIDLWRKRGLGLLAADFGPGYLAQDIASRHFLYRGDTAAEWASYAEDAKSICTRFAAGINAYVGLTEREPDRLPQEFRLFGTRPARWQPEDVVRIRSHGLTRNALSELARAHVLARADAATDRLRKTVEPPVEVGPLPGFDPEAVPPDALKLFRLAMAPVTFPPERLAATLDEAPLWRVATDLGEVLRAQEFEGSNNWAVDGSRTATGRPILATDPHRTHAVPSLRYLVHLTAPGFDAIGAGEPSVPGIMMGHNGTAAFSLTIFGADQEDVYLYETKPDDPDAYRYGDGWERMRTVEERFAVKGAPEQARTLRFTRHGPVVHADPARRSAVAVRSVWFEPGSAAYLASLSGMRSRSLDEFRAAMRRWGTPSVNQVYADTAGTIAWLPAGHVPRRPNWRGLAPVPGDGSHEWDGMMDPVLMPALVNPPGGFVATANELNLPPDWPHDDRPVGFEWLEDSRAVRIREVLAGQHHHSLADSQALQADTLSVPARRMQRLLAPLEARDADARRGLGLLRNWDTRLDAGSAAAALFELWWTKHLKPALFARLVPDPAIRRLLAPGDVAGILAALEAPDARFGDDPMGVRDALLLETLAEAVRDATHRLGSDASAWRWGDLHHGYFEHPASAVAPNRRGEFDVGPLPKSGSGSTVMHAAYRPDDFRVTHGASVRIVMDVGDWDRSTCINAPGQSGDPRSPHYRDLAPLWACGEQVPLLYSRAAVEEAAELRIRLVPQSSH
ncbi:penicillin acylase family protein [Mycobacterium sp. KBS0706]|uniref:penicillin acylase family protein n=1 Tax=Mycobacterium sp. KBS0706 TaxID=2578109 RepID=UPI00110F92DC|nr:penicillin acylase family protein [Mycobacterium sp. KBS0706]TSD85931.1 penicillin acylase family protein [Mycobacterium sp. KBS0706]